ncbi:MAG: SfnB family sulfur acquisition oxidoreductase [Patulibacter minatonensis]
MPTAEGSAAAGNDESGALGSSDPPATGLPPAPATHDDAVAIARTLAARLATGAAERDRAGGVPWEALAQIDRSGLLSLTLPTVVDGPGLGAPTLAEVVRLLAAADPAIAQTLQPHFLFPTALFELGVPHGRAKLAATILAGGRIGNAVAERGGQHAQDFRTRLVHDAAGHPRLRGRKYYCTGAISSASIAVTAIDERDQQILAFVPRDAPGVTTTDDWSAMGQRATVSGTTTFDDVLVDPDLVIPYGELFEAPQTLGARAQLVHAAIEVGIARGALDDAAEFLRAKARPFFEAVRGGWAERATDDPHTVHRFGELDVRVHAAEALLARAAQHLDEVPVRPDDPEHAAEASIAVARAKAYGSEVAVLVASDLFALTGTSAADEQYDLHRHWRNARTHSVHDPVAWKYHHIGAYGISGTLPPNHGQL